MYINIQLPGMVTSFFLGFLNLVKLQNNTFQKLIILMPFSSLPLWSSLLGKFHFA